MKNIVIAIALLTSLGLYAQEKKTVAKPITEDYNFMCKTMEINKEAKTIILTEDASYKDSIIEITGAEQIVFDQASNEIIATGPYNFTIDGAVTLTPGEGTKKLRYKIGEAVAYIE